MRLLEEEARRPFDLGTGTLLRALLLRLDETEHVLLLTIHHIACDGWSIQILRRELATLYNAFTASEPSTLSELPIQYVDYAEWQREQLQDETLQTQLAYWKKQLEGESPALEFPCDRARPAILSDRGEFHHFVIPEHLTQQLKALSGQSGVSFFMTLLAAYQTFLYRYTGQEDFCIGTAAANRETRETESLIGLFVNTLVLRARIRPEMSFRELLAEVKHTALGAYSHQDLPFEKLVEELQPIRKLNGSPLFQTMFVLQNTPGTDVTFNGITLHPLRIDSHTAKYDLTFSLHEDTEILNGTFEYRTEIFERATIARMARHFQTLLEGIVAQPAAKLHALPMLTSDEVQHLIADWCASEIKPIQHETIHQAFAAQVRRTPDAVAVVCGERRLTYLELDRRANKVARQLVKNGARSETLVGICMERSAELIVCLLGILKSGAAYLPLDPAYPEEQLLFMLRDTKASLLLTETRYADVFTAANVKVINLDKEWNSLERESGGSFDGERAQESLTNRNLAYVMFTSGSTGTPKGVAIEHRSVMRLVCAASYVDLSAAETLLHLAPFNFDASTFEIWGALLNGAQLVLYPNSTPTPQELGDFVRFQGITTLWLTAALFNTVIDENPNALAGVRQLLIGGESLSVTHVRRALELLPATNIINGYGPTENTTFTCCHPIPRCLDDSLRSIPIGRPIANTQVYILDTHLNPVPVGVAGELYIGGDGLARG
ncbi:MAG: non-ribosomal peptide synthetase, partial [Pyrinomonadaceae bacterium]